jgi:cell division septum initiation protein DivIVA
MIAQAREQADQILRNARVAAEQRSRELTESAQRRLKTAQEDADRMIETASRTAKQRRAELEAVERDLILRIKLLEQRHASLTDQTAPLRFT